jgi:hypothetical protein
LITHELPGCEPFTYTDPESMVFVPVYTLFFVRVTLPDGVVKYSMPNGPGPEITPSRTRALKARIRTGPVSVIGPDHVLAEFKD